MLADFGYNMLQVGDPAYGLSFSLDCELDMRYDINKGIPCSLIINKISEFELENVFVLYYKCRVCIQKFECFFFFF